MPRSAPSKQRKIEKALTHALISEGIASMSIDALDRVKDIGSSRIRRRKGMGGTTPEEHEASMSLRYPLAPNANVLFLDDVFTSGSTMRAAAKILRTKGGHKGTIYGLSVGYAINHPDDRPDPFKPLVSGPFGLVK
jgi:phosphoribosylpyrophosphate synthetase